MSPSLLTYKKPGSQCADTLSLRLQGEGEHSDSASPPPPGRISAVTDGALARREGEAGWYWL